MLDSGDPADRVCEFAPGVALRLEDLFAGWRQAVAAAAALSGFLDPPSLNPSALLEAIQQRVERGDAELENAARARFDQLAQVVTVARLVLDQRENQQLRAALLQLAVQHAGFHML